MISQGGIKAKRGRWRKMAPFCWSLPSAESCATANELRELAEWYRQFAERAGDPRIWEARLLTADKLEMEADRLDEAKRLSPGVIETNEESQTCNGEISHAKIVTKGSVSAP
jgi:hypothetical protein